MACTGLWRTWRCQLVGLHIGTVLGMRCRPAGIPEALTGITVSQVSTNIDYISIMPAAVNTSLGYTAIYGAHSGWSVVVLRSPGDADVCQTKPLAPPCCKMSSCIA